MWLAFSLGRVDEVSVRKALLYLTDDLRKALHSRVFEDGQTSM